MPFVQMENISHFLRACQSPPLNLQPHDVFLTVDLYEKKDPAQVIQCLGAFSRVANKINPSKFPTAIGGRSAASALSPHSTGTPTVTLNRGRGTSNASNGSSGVQPGKLTPTATGGSNSGWRSPTRSGAPSPGVSSWSKKHDEGATSPAWNIAQYGYMGGASQGNMGISFGGRRQITTAAPHVPNAAEKEKRRKEEEAEKARLQAVAEQAEAQKLKERQAEEEAAQLAEEEKWAEETRKARENAQREAEEENRKWEAEERRWKEEEEARQREEREAEARLQKERQRARGNSDARLQGQFLSQYQSEHGISRGGSHASADPSSRVAELERELELARERERQYERERQERISARSHNAIEEHDLASRMKTEGRPQSRARSRSRPRAPSRPTEDETWRKDEREYLRKQWEEQHPDTRPLPQSNNPVRVKTNTTGPSPRPLPDPATYTSPTTTRSEYFSSPEQPKQSRTDRYLNSNPAPQAEKARQTYSAEIGGFDSTAERDAEDRRRLDSQTKTKAGGWASKSLLEREMELERQRQQEWEEEQKRVAQRKADGKGVDGIGGGIDGSHDISQWSSYTRGDGGNRGNLGIGAGRRQIVGPRPPPGR